MGGRCAMCGSIEKLEFDHVNRENKSFDISQKLNICLDKILLELEKCQLLCRKCHIEKTRKDLNWGVGHGTYTWYKYRDCRCNLCKRANAEYVREYRARKALV